MTRTLLYAAFLLLWFFLPVSRGGELYYTGFENFTPGFDRIAGTDGWTGSGSHAGLKLSGVDLETTHGVAGIGNAAFIGGNPAVLTPGLSTTVNVRKPLNVDPVALNQEIVQFRVNCGIADSTPAVPAAATRRDNFEFAFYNQAGQLIGFIQFDNATIDSATSAPSQIIRRSSYNGASLTKVSTGAVFYYNLLMELVVRINFRTNRWSVWLDGLELFTDEIFYSGPNARNLGVLAAQMQIMSTGLNTSTGQLGPAPGSNYMLFDDFAVRTDPLPPPVILDLTVDASTGAPTLTWLSEALYHYQVQYTDTLNAPWKPDLPASYSTATDTGTSPAFTDTSAIGRPRRYYRVLRTDP